MGFRVTLEVCLQQKKNILSNENFMKGEETKNSHFGFCIRSNFPADDASPDIPILVDHRLSIGLVEKLIRFIVQLQK